MQWHKIYQKSVGAVDSSGMSNTAAFTFVHRILIRVPFGQLKRYHSAFQLLKETIATCRSTYGVSSKSDSSRVTIIPSIILLRKLRLLLSKPNLPSVKLCLHEQRLRKVQMVCLKTQHKILHQEHTYSTQAFTDKGPTHSVSHLIVIMRTEVNKDTKDYVPFQMHCRSPDAFVHGAKNRYYQKYILLAHQRVVMIKNLGIDAIPAACIT